MESTKITENFRQVKLKAEEIQLFKQSFIIVPYQVSGFIDFSNRGALSGVATPQDYETFKRVWTGNDACVITWKNSFYLLQNNETKKLEQKYRLGETFLGILETNSFDNEIKKDESFSEYTSQQQVNTVTFRVDKYFEITDYYNFMFYKIPELSGSTLYRIESIEKDYAGRDLLGYVITFKTINQELSNTGRARQQNIMPCAPGQGYLECVVEDSTWPDRLGKERFDKLVEGKDYYKFFDRYITADYQKIKNVPIKKVVVKLLGNGILNSFVMIGRPINSEEDRVFESQSLLFGINLNEPETPTLFRTQNNTQNFYYGEFVPTLQFYKEFFQTIKDFMGNVNGFNYSGWLGFNYNKLTSTNTLKDGRYEFSLYGKLNEDTLYNEPWEFTTDIRHINTQNVDGCLGNYNIGGKKKIHDHLFDNFWTQKMLKTLPQNIYETLAYGKLWSSSLAIGAAGAQGGLITGIGGFLVGTALAVVGLFGINKNRNQQKKFTPIRGVCSAPFFDYNNNLFKATISSELPNSIPFNFLDNNSGIESPNQAFFKGNTLNICFEADITDTFTIDRLPGKVLKTINIGQDTFENGDKIFENGEKLLMNGDATLRKSDSYGYIIDGIKIQAIFNGEISVEFLDINGDIAWSGIYQSEAKWTDSMREIWTEKNCSVFGKENVYFSEPVPYPKPLPEKTNPFIKTLSVGELIIIDKKWNNPKNEKYVPITTTYPNDWKQGWGGVTGWFQTNAELQPKLFNGQTISNKIKVFTYNNEIPNFSTFKNIYKYLELDFKHNLQCNKMLKNGAPNSHGWEFNINDIYSIFDKLTINIVNDNLGNKKQIDLSNIINKEIGDNGQGVNYKRYQYNPFSNVEYVFINNDNGELELHFIFNCLSQTIKQGEYFDETGNEDYDWAPNNEYLNNPTIAKFKSKISYDARGSLINFYDKDSWVRAKIFIAIVMRQE